MPITAVLFDLGGTLFDYVHREQMGRPFGAALERLGLDPTDPAVVDARRLASQEVERRYAALPAFVHRDLFRERVARTAELCGRIAGDDVLDRFDAEHLQAIFDHLVPRPDARATLEGLRARHVYAAVVSNADDDYLGPLLRRHELDGLLDDWTSSEEARSCKPDRRIYEHALAKAGRPAAEALFVGDSLPHDVAGAHAVGLRTVLIGEPGTVAPLSHGLDADVAPDHEVRSLTEVLAIVDAAAGTP